MFLINCWFSRAGNPSRDYSLVAQICFTIPLDKRFLVINSFPVQPESLHNKESQRDIGGKEQCQARQEDHVSLVHWIPDISIRPRDHKQLGWFGRARSTVTIFPNINST